MSVFENGKEIERVPVDSIGASKRGWINIAQVLAGVSAILMSDQAQMILAAHPAWAGAALVVSSGINWWLTKQAKKNVLYKVREVKPLEGRK